MKTTAGLWIDHRKAVIVTVTGKKLETRVIESHVEKHPGRHPEEKSSTPYESQLVQADDRRERKFTGKLNTYYDEIVSALHDAESILIFGPGEAKGELAKRFKKDNLEEHIAAVETVDEMTDRQITAKVREYFL